MKEIGGDYQTGAGPGFPGIACQLDGLAGASRPRASDDRLSSGEPSRTAPRFLDGNSHDALLLLHREVGELAGGTAGHQAVHMRQNVADQIAVSFFVEFFIFGERRNQGRENTLQPRYFDRHLCPPINFDLPPASLGQQGEKRQLSNFGLRKVADQAIMQVYRR
jgi:hypothetical protein